MDQFKERDQFGQSKLNDDGTHKVIDAIDLAGQRTEFQSGQRIGDRYEVISKLGKGGMGLVYRVNQIFLNKEFALKTLDKDSMSEIPIRRFQQEARTAFALDHPNIIAVNDFGLVDDRTPFLVMELVNGETLSDRLKRVGCLPLEQVIPIMVQVCFGLSYAHECGIVHRDIKPTNIMLLNGMPLGAEGSVKILDFGIAKFTAHEGGEIQALTRTGEIFGSPLYMSPEQCAGTNVDQRADTYSLGCVLFESLTGTPPFIGDSALATMMKHLNEPAPTLKEASLGKDFPQGIEDIVATMLAKSPDSRYQNLGTVAHDLGALKRGDSISQTARSPSRVEQGTKPISMSRISFCALLLAVIAVAGLSGYVVRDLQHRDRLQRPNAEPLNTFSQTQEIPQELEFKPISSEWLREELGRHKNTLDLPGCIVTDNVLATLGNSPWIQGLVLSGASLSNNGLANLTKIHLLKIKLDRSNFNDNGARKLALCRGLSNVSAEDTGLSDDGIIELAKIKGLKTLGIRKSKITDASLVELSKSKDLTYLDIAGATAITSNGLAALQHTHLQNLILDSTPIDDAGLSHISKIDTLTKIGLNRTKVTILGIQELCKNKNLVLIGIRHCPMLKQEDIQRLRQSFKSIQFDYQDRTDPF
ncbi:MAG TPA: protein kinase [Trichormus sp.]